MSTERGGHALRTKSNIGMEERSAFSAWFCENVVTGQDRVAFSLSTQQGALLRL